MVHVVTPRPSIGSALGQALGAVGGEYAGYQTQRQRSINALNQARELANRAETPSDLYFAMQQGAMGNPEAQRAVAAGFPLLLQQQQARLKASEEAQRAASGIQEGVERMGPPGQVPGIVSKEQFVEKARDKLGERYFPDIQIPEPGEVSYKPQKPPLPPKPIGPKEESAMRADLKRDGINDPQLQNEYIAAAKQYQKDYYKASEEGFRSYADYQQALKEEDTRFLGSVDERINALHPNMSPEKRNIWEGISRLAENAGPDEARFRNTEQMYDNLVENPLRSFNENVQDLPVGSIFRPELINERINNAKSLVQDHLRAIDKKGFPDELKSEIKNNLRDSYFTAMVAKDYGTAQAAKVVSNLSNEFIKAVPLAPEEKDTVYETVSFNNDPKLREKYVDKLADALLQNLSKEDSLILAREQAIHKNYDDAAFNQALRKAIGKGLQLSDFQRNERSKLEIPYRLDLDTIMNGKRSIWDKFKGKI